MPTGMWYADPTHRHQSRYADAGKWTEFVADNGAVTRDPITAAVRRRRRKWPWIVGTIGVVMLVVIGMLGLQAAINDLDRYSADLTQGHGDFVTVDNGVSARSYETDGYHVLIRAPETWGVAAVKAPTSHTRLGVQIDMRPVRVPQGAAFGPFCWKDSTHGYGFVVDSAGVRKLVQLDGPNGSDARVLATSPGAPLATDHATKLMVTCEMGLTGAVNVRGYVDGTKAIEADGQMSLSEVNYTGFAGHTAQAANSEWAVAHFWRLGADDVPD
jgi:hypothetical protein